MLRGFTSARLRLEQLEPREVPAVFVVTNTADSGSGSLRAALAAANDETANPGADTIRFASSLFGQTIGLTTPDADGSFGPSALSVNSTVIIDGLAGYTSGPGITIARQTGAAEMRLFLVTATGNLTLRGLTLTGGVARGGDGIFGGGGAAGLGGGVFNAGALTVERSTLTANTAIGGIGAPVDPNGIELGGGGGLGFDAVAPGGLVLGDGGGPNGGFAIGNIPGAGGIGGGGSGGGGIGGFGGGGGGGTGGLDSGFGGGLSGSGGGGGGGALGGAVFNSGGTVVLANSTIADNTVTGGAGAGSSGAAFGSALFNLNGTVTATNCTFAETDSAAGVVYNLAHEAANGITATAAELELVNCVIAQPGNFVALVNNRLVLAADAILTATAPNLVFSTDGLGPSLNGNGTFDGSGIVTADPLLGALADNGGPTRTRLPLANSPVLNAGLSSAATGFGTDQRGAGFVRVFGSAVELGAVEVSPPAPPAPPAPPPSPPVVPPSAPGAPNARAVPPVVLDAPPGTGVVRALSAEGRTLFAVAPFGALAGRVVGAAADFNRDGTFDFVFAGGGTVSLFDGATGARFDFVPFAGGGELRLAAGDLTADGTPDLAVSGTDGRVLVIDGAGRGAVFVTAHPGHTGVTELTIGDLTGDGVNELVTAARRANGLNLFALGVALPPTGPLVLALPAGADRVSVAVTAPPSGGRGDLVVSVGSAVAVLDVVAGRVRGAVDAFGAGVTAPVSVRAVGEDVWAVGEVGARTAVRRFDGDTLSEIDTFFADER